MISDLGLRISDFESRCVASVPPSLSARSSAQQAPDRSKPPAIGPAPSLKLPAIQKQKLSNGLAVWIVEHHEVPLAQINLIVRSGSAADPIGKYGVGSLAAAMLDEGAGTRSSLELADALEFLGANLSTTSSFDYSAIRMSVPVSKLGDALPLMADVALRPTFPANELDRLKKERLTALLQARDNPAALIQLAFPRVVFGPTHRYGTSANGLPPAIEAFTVADLQAFYRAHYRPDNATLLIVGDVTPASAMPMLEKAFGSWKADGMAPLVAEVPTAPQLKSRQIYIVDKPERAQSQIRIGWVGVPRSTAGLRRARSAEHDPRRLVHVAPQPEPARRSTATATAPARRSTCGSRRVRSLPPPACRPTRPVTAVEASSSTS